MTGPHAAFAQARIQAAYSALPHEEHWDQLRGARNLSAYLEEARNGPFRLWVRGYSAQSEPHVIERGLRMLFIERVEQTCAVVPWQWRPMLMHWRWVPYLPIIAGLGPGQPMPAWTALDAVLGCLTPDPGGLPSQVSSCDQLAELMMFAGDPDALAAFWLQRWYSSLGHLGQGSRANVTDLAEQLMQHLNDGGTDDHGDAWRMRRELREHLRAQFHRVVMRPLVALIYLSLLALDLERLRRALVDRALFDALPGHEDGAPEERRAG